MPAVTFVFASEQAWIEVLSQAKTSTGCGIFVHNRKQYDAHIHLGLERELSSHDELCLYILNHTAQDDSTAVPHEIKWIGETCVILPPSLGIERKYVVVELEERAIGDRWKWSVVNARVEDLHQPPPNVASLDYRAKSNRLA